MSQKHGLMKRCAIILLIFKVANSQPINKKIDYTSNFTCRSNCDGDFDLCSTVVKSFPEAYVCLKVASVCRANCDRTKAVEGQLEPLKPIKTEHSSTLSKHRPKVVGHLPRTRLSPRLERIWEK